MGAVSMTDDLVRARSLLCDSGLDAVILASPANVQYATGHSCWIQPLMRDFMLAPGAGSAVSGPAIAVLAAHGRPALVAPAFFGFDAVLEPEVDVYLYGVPEYVGRAVHRLDTPAARVRLQRAIDAAACYPDCASALASAISASEINHSAVAVDLDTCVRGAERVIASVIPSGVERDCSHLMRLIRMVKSKDEIELLRQAAQISENAATAAVAGLQSGFTPCDLIDAFKSRVGAGGADFDHFTYTVDGIAMGSGRRTDINFVKGDVVAIDWGCVLGGYFSDTGTTLTCGPASTAAMDAHSLLARCVDAGFQELRPGVAATEAHLSMMSLLAGEGIFTAYPHGHGLGLEIRDLPILAEPRAARICDDVVDVSSDIPLEPGMVVNLEATLLMPEFGAVEVERSFVLTVDGAEPLVRQPRETPFLAGSAPHCQSEHPPERPQATGVH